MEPPSIPLITDGGRVNIKLLNNTQKKRLRIVQCKSMQSFCTIQIYFSFLGGGAYVPITDDRVGVFYTAPGILPVSLNKKPLRERLKPYSKVWLVFHTTRIFAANYHYINRVVLVLAL